MRVATSSDPSRRWRLLAVAMACLALVSAGCASTSPDPAPDTAVPASPAAASALPSSASSGAAMPATPTTSPTVAGTASPAPSAIADTGPRFDEARCPFEISEEYEVECGYLVVPEDRAAPGGRTVRLHVAMFSTTNPLPQPDPVVFLNGGPGGDTLAVAEYIVQRTPFLQDRDLILFDQRGTGYSEPSLDCPEATEVLVSTLDEVHEPEEWHEIGEQAARRCRDRLLGEEVALSAYTTSASAADVEDLRRALGYREWNLYGISYGTRLALVTMRDHPEGIRSVILDAAYPPEVDIEVGLARNIDEVVVAIFSSCAADTRCSRAYPRLDEVFSEVFARLEREPARLTVLDLSEETSYEVRLDGEHFAASLFEMLYSTDRVPSIPRVIYEARDGRFDAVAENLSELIEASRMQSEGVYSAVECAEEAPFVRPGAIREGAAGVRPEIFQTFTFHAESFLRTCESVWRVPPAPASADEPVRSTIPTLLLAGEYDPITPPDFARRAAANLEQSFLYEFPGVGHGVVGSRFCADALTLRFLRDPSERPNATCLRTLHGPRFLLPSDAPTPLPPKRYRDEVEGFELDLPGHWLRISADDLDDPAALDRLLQTDPELGQLIRAAPDELSAGVLLLAHDRAANDPVTTATPTLTVARLIDALNGESFDALVKDWVDWIDESEPSRPATKKRLRLDGHEAVEIVYRYPTEDREDASQLVYVDYVVKSGDDVFLMSFARREDVDPNAVASFRRIARTLRLLPSRADP